MKKITLIFVVINLFLFSTLFSEGKKWGKSLKRGWVTEKIQKQQEKKGIYFMVPELYIGVEKDPGKIMYSASVLGCYNFPEFGAIGLKIGNYKSQNDNLLASSKSTTRIMTGYIGSMFSILAGIDFNEATDTQKKYSTPVIEARFIWPLLLYEEALLITQPSKDKLLFKNRLGIGLVVFEAGWEYEIINIEEEVKTRNAVFVAVFHVLTFSFGKDYFYGGLRFMI